MYQKEVTDLYEAAWLLAGGCRIEAVECIPLSGTLSCRFTAQLESLISIGLRSFPFGKLPLYGKDLSELEEVFYKKEAQVNVHAFRSAYGQVNSLVHEAKKNYDRQLRELRRTGGGCCPGGSV